jgi:mono/diheme cytochrome c family protein
VAVLYRLRNGGFVVNDLIRYFSLATVVGLMAACGGESGAPAAEETQEPAQEESAPAEEAAAPAQEMTMDLPEGVTAEMVAQGDEIFHGQGICYTCHMQGGTGGPLAPDLTDDQWINVDGSYDAIVELVINGVPEPIEHPGIMLPKGGTNITDEQVRAVAAYAWALSRSGD